MKRKTTRKDIYKLKFWDKLFIEWIEREKDFVEPIIHINNRSFNLQALIRGKSIQ